MSARLPPYIIRALDRLNIDPNYSDIKDQCGSHADPLYQDWHYNIICDTLAFFVNRNITRKQLFEWGKSINALYPWTDDYDIFRQIVNRRFNMFPALIAMTTKLSQVKQAFSIASNYHIPFCIRGGAHSYEPFSTIGVGGIIIDQSRRTNIYINHNTNQVTIEPGVLNGPLADELGKHNLAIAQGTCANVGVIGLCLGGGMGFLGRKYGLTCDNLISFKIITADGKHLYVDRDINSDLFWACKGAGNGNFGIITEMTLQAHYVPEVTIFELRWTFNKLYSVLNSYFDWLRQSNSVGIEMDIYSLELKYPILITGIYPGSKEKLNKYLTSFYNLKPDEVKIWTTTYTESARHFTYNKFPPPYFKNKSYYVYDNLPQTVIPIIKKYMKTAGPNDRIEINGLGSAYNKYESSYSHRGALGWIQFIARWSDGNDINDKNITPGWENLIIGPEKIKWVNTLYNDIKKVANKDKKIIKGAYVGCFDSEIPNYLEQYYGNNLPRLRKIKAKYDPENRFKYPQSIN